MKMFCCFSFYGITELLPIKNLFFRSIVIVLNIAVNDFTRESIFKKPLHFRFTQIHLSTSFDNFFWNPDLYPSTTNNFLFFSLHKNS